MEKQPIGTVAHLLLTFQTRDDHDGLAIHFLTAPGRFSPMAQTAIQQAIYRAARARPGARFLDGNSVGALSRRDDLW